MTAALKRILTEMLDWMLSVDTQNDPETLERLEGLKKVVKNLKKET